MCAFFAKLSTNHILLNLKYVFVFFSKHNFRSNRLQKYLLQKFARNETTQLAIEIEIIKTSRTRCVGGSHEHQFIDIIIQQLVKL